MIIGDVDAAEVDRASVRRPNGRVREKASRRETGASAAGQVPHPKILVSALPHYRCGDPGAIRGETSAAVNAGLGDLGELFTGCIQPYVAVASRTRPLLIEQIALRGDGKDRASGDIVGSNLVDHLYRIARNFSIRGIKPPGQQRSSTIGEQP